jgi:hypothetical protein
VLGKSVFSGDLLVLVVSSSLQSNSHKSSRICSENDKSKENCKMESIGKNYLK